MPRIPESYRIAAVDHLRELKPHPQLIDGSEVESVAKLLYSVRALKKRFPRVDGYMFVTYTESDEDAHISLEFSFADGMGMNKPPDREFLKHILKQVSQQIDEALDG